jgi:DNA-binding HxlR family transcriptional regulator
MALLDMLSRRGALRVQRELRGEPLNFRAPQDACDSHPSLLNAQLKELRSASYFLTPRGRELFELRPPLSIWAEQWTRSREPS